jgi:hypothetical protein
MAAGLMAVNIQTTTSAARDLRPSRRVLLDDGKSLLSLQKKTIGDKGLKKGINDFSLPRWSNLALTFEEFQRSEEYHFFLESPSLTPSFARGGQK